jgi:hypothetical protein
MNLPQHSLRHRVFLLASALAILGTSWWLAALTGRPLNSAGSNEQEMPSLTPASATADARARQLARLGADRWPQAGHEGKGVKVAVLDCGFRGYREHLGKALPARVTVKTFRADGNFEGHDTQHGILCAEVVHAVAPQAELILANWESDRPDTFLAAVRWARDQGARVLTCSVISPNWSDGEGNGPVHAELTRLLRDGGLLFFACAGNTAQRHWQGRFQDAGKGFHEWRPGEVDNPVTPWSSERVSLELSAPDGSEYEQVVQDAETGDEVAKSVKGAAPGSAVVRFRPEDGKRYRLRVRRLSGADSFHVVGLAAGLGMTAAGGSIPFPGDGSEVITVGAVDEHGKRQSYSACGPNSRRPKPDLVAPVPWVPLCRSRSFGGTSAAAPQAAGLAALSWGKNQDQTAEQVRSALSTTARDLGPRGHDWETGFGMVNLPEAAGVQLPRVNMR